MLLQANNVYIDDETLQKYMRFYQNSIGVDYVKLWQRIETIRASPGMVITRFTFALYNLRFIIIALSSFMLGMCRKPK